jgi:pimeloyl-ACP methyl ester carboxylesterase
MTSSSRGTGVGLDGQGWLLALRLRLHSGSAIRQTGEMELGRVLEYESSGSGEAILFIHGAIVADSFAPIMREEVLADFRLIRYRRRGFGGSAAPGNPPTIEEHARDAKALLDDLGVTAAHVVAHSGGGPIAVQLAIDEPKVVRSMILLDPALMNAAMAAGFHEMVTPLVRMHQAGESSKAVDVWMSAGNADWKTLIEENITGIGDQANADAAGTFDFDLTAMRSWDFEAVDARLITQPVLYITGERSGHRESVAAMFRAAVPHTLAKVLPDADHIVPMTDPGAVANVIAAFLRGLPVQA